MLLNCHTYFSFCYGTLSVEQMLDEIQQKGYQQFVLTDINNTSACLETYRLATERGLTPLLGIDFRNGIQQQYIGIAQSNEGFRELNEHLSHHLHNKLDFPKQAPEFNQVYIIYPFATHREVTLAAHEYLGVNNKDITSLSFFSHSKNKDKLVILHPLTFQNKRQYNAHRLLRAIDKNTLLSKLPVAEQAPMQESILSLEELNQLFYPYPKIRSNTENILKNCSLQIEYGKLANKNLKHYTSGVAEDVQFLRTACMQGLAYRYPHKPSKEVLERVEKELKIIEQMNFASYYLINYDIIRYAQSKNYYYVGRGSGANSMVAYLLRITDVDPIDLDLYFERFINPFRSNAPDFDIDFSWTDRDDITRYIFERFGHERTALLGTYSTFQKDAVIRELGKVFGLPPAEIDRLQAADKYPDIDEQGKQLLRYSELIQGFPSHLGIHASGIIISQEPVHCYTATYLPPKGYPTTQFSMLEAEDIGLFKFDILSQRGLGKIKDALQIISENKRVEIDIHQVNDFKQDEKVKELLRHGKTIACFYVESPAMRMLLTKLKADDYLRLVAASSIIRPGVSKSGMMREYILRFRNQNLREKAREQLPELYDLLQETYGVMVYQEDVIKVAHFFAGLSLAEADYLRRGMSWKFKQRNEFYRVKENFINNCLKKGYAEKQIIEIWNQIESFANFAFSKGHSASYAVESYQALYLKAHYPLEYLTATLNNGGGFYRKDLYIHDARMHGAEIIAPCINNSGALCVLKENRIYLGLAMVAELEEQAIQQILTERKKNGAFQNLADFVKRIPVSIEQLRLLVRAGTFNFTGRERKELLWEIYTLINPAKKKQKENTLFEVDAKTYQLPAFTTTALEEAYQQIELLGFSLCSPFDLLRDPITETRCARDLAGMNQQQVQITGYLINVKTTYTANGLRMGFGTFIDLRGEWIDTVHFPESLKQQPFSGNGCYLISGKVTEEYDFITIEVNTLKRLAVKEKE